MDKKWKCKVFFEEKKGCRWMRGTGCWDRVWMSIFSGIVNVSIKIMILSMTWIKLKQEVWVFPFSFTISFCTHNCSIMKFHNIEFTLVDYRGWLESS